MNLWNNLVHVQVLTIVCYCIWMVLTYPMGFVWCSAHNKKSGQSLGQMSTKLSRLCNPLFVTLHGSSFVDITCIMQFISLHGLHAFIRYTCCHYRKNISKKALTQGSFTIINISHKDKPQAGGERICRQCVFSKVLKALSWKSVDCMLVNILMIVKNPLLYNLVAPWLLKNVVMNWSHL